MKKGFTLVELLGVIVILGIIGMITVPLVQRTIIENNQKLCQDQVTSFERAARNYANKNVYQTETERPGVQREDQAECYSGSCKRKENRYG